MHSLLSPSEISNVTKLNLQYISRCKQQLKLSIETFEKLYHNYWSIA